MNLYLLDTNICIAFFKKVPRVHDALTRIEQPHLCISEISLAELKYGAAKSNRPEHHRAVLEDFLEDVLVVGISGCLDVFAEEKARLSRSGEPIDNFDLLIGATAIAHNMILVTNNTKHFQRLAGIKLEDWTK